jgi:hypothetical protein
VVRPYAGFESEAEVEVLGVDFFVELGSDFSVVVVVELGDVEGEAEGDADGVLCTCE